MQDFQTPWPVFIAIVLGWLAMAFFFLAGRKVFFEPYKEPKDGGVPATAPKEPAASEETK